MKYHDIAPMCRPLGSVTGCPHDGLGCIGGEKCSINSPDESIRMRAWTAEQYGPDFVCKKRVSAIERKKVKQLLAK